MKIMVFKKEQIFKKLKFLAYIPNLNKNDAKKIKLR